MTMTTTVEKLRALKIYNTWELLRRFADPGQDVACAYHPPDNRACRAAGTAVFSPSHKTSPDEPWYNEGRKVFTGDMVRSLPAAMAWASEKYGVKQWATCPTNRTARVPVVVRERALAAIR